MVLDWYWYLLILKVAVQVMKKWYRPIPTWIQIQLRTSYQNQILLELSKTLQSLEFQPRESNHRVPGNMIIKKSTAFIINITPFIHILWLLTKQPARICCRRHFFTRKACRIRGCTLRHGGLANKVKRTVIFHFIETSACTLPLLLLLSLHVSLILSLQATDSLVPLHPHTFPHCPCMPLTLSLSFPFLYRGDSSCTSLTVNSPGSALQARGFISLLLARLSPDSVIYLGFPPHFLPSSFSLVLFP